MGSVLAISIASYSINMNKREKRLRRINKIFEPRPDYFKDKKRENHEEKITSPLLINE